MNHIVLASAGSLLIGSAALAGGMTIPLGTYNLNNHPGTAIDPPNYGLRLDDLPGLDAGDWTFDFNHASSSMQMVLLDNGGNLEIHISGQSYGGRDIGGGYAAGSEGLFDIAFSYTVGVMDTNDGGTWSDLAVMADNGSNMGSIAYANDAINGANAGNAITDLFDFSGSFPATFFLGDEDSGHAGATDEISGWGWMNYTADGPHVYSTDWLFIAKLIPTPGAASLLALSGLALLGRRRRA